MSENECVKVIVRARPMNSREKEDNRKNILQINTKAGSVAIVNPAEPDYEPKSFTFDAAYDDKSTQRQVYDEVAYPLVESVIKGFNGTIFAYGQTGCGKTHTMVGKSEPPELRGIIPNSFVHVFNTIKAAPSNVKYLVQASFIEIYNEEVRDLLGTNTKAKLDLKEDPQKGVFVKDLTWKIVKNEDEIDHVMTIGNANRTVGSTLMNAESSRSHSIFTMVIECEEEDEALADDNNGNNEKRSHIHAGKLNLVDLAGSERASKTGAQGDRLKEGCKINLSLSALGNVISALVAGKGKHIPYRDSKLTRLLQDSLGGNTKTIMCAALGPADYNYEETLSTLRYANRAKNIKNKPTINEDPKDALLRQYKDEIERLTKLLEAQNKGIPLDQLMNNNNQQSQQQQQPQIIIKEVIKEVVKEVPIERIKEIVREVEVPIESDNSNNNSNKSNNNNNNNNNGLLEVESTSQKCRRISKKISRGERSFSDSEEDLSISSRSSNNKQQQNHHNHHHERRKSDLPISPVKGLMSNKIIEEEEEVINDIPKSARPDLIPFNNNNSINDNNDDEIYDPFDDTFEKSTSYNTPRKSSKISKLIIKTNEERMVNDIPKVKEVVKEVISEKQLEKEKALEEYNNAILKQRDKLSEELNKQKQDFENAEKAKLELERQLQLLKKQLQSNIIENENVESVEVKIAREEVMKRRKEQEKLQEEKKKEKMKIEKEKKSNNSSSSGIDAEENLKNENKEEVKELKDEIKRLKRQLKASNQDIEDREEEFEIERQDLLETIRELTRESFLYNKIILNFISRNELGNVWSKSKYDEENEDWIIPPIIPKSNWRNVVPLPDINLKIKNKEKKHHNINNNNDNNNNNNFTPQLPHPPIYNNNNNNNNCNKYINKLASSDICNVSRSRPLSRRIIDKSINNNNNNNNNRPNTYESENNKSLRFSPLDIDSLNNNNNNCNNNIKTGLPLINNNKMNINDNDNISSNESDKVIQNEEFTLPSFKKPKNKKKKNDSINKVVNENVGNENNDKKLMNLMNNKNENDNSFEDSFGLYDF